jgi:hypothetical protein
MLSELRAQMELLLMHEQLHSRWLVGMQRVLWGQVEGKGTAGKLCDSRVRARKVYSVQGVLHVLLLMHLCLQLLLVELLQALDVLLLLDLLLRVEPLL